MEAIVGTKLILEDSIIWDGAITFENGVIVQAGKAEDVKIPAGAHVIDAHGLYTAPGLIDIHNHGGPDVLFHEDPVGCVSHVLKHGVTSVLPTFYCNLSAETMIEGAKRLKDYAKDKIGSIVAGLYMEGPYMGGFGSNQKTIQWQGDILPEEYQPLLDAVGDFARIWAICPAREGIERFMRDINEQYPNAVFALGHSRATSEQCRKVSKYGVRVQTHHGDSGKAKGRNQVTIGSGCDEYTLYQPEMYAEMICDQNGVHLDPDLIKMVVRTKGVEHVILISDSMPDPNHYTNNEADGVMYGPDLNYDYEGHLAGSHLTLDAACRNMISHTGCGICQAIRMASLNPARLLKIDRDYGSIEPGKKANLILIDDMVNVNRVILNGETVVQNSI